MCLTLQQSSSSLRFASSWHIVGAVSVLGPGSSPLTGRGRAFCRQRPAVRAGDGNCGTWHAFHQPLLHADAAETKPRCGAEDCGGAECGFQWRCPCSTHPAAGRIQIFLLAYKYRLFISRWGRWGAHRLWTLEGDGELHQRVHEVSPRGGFHHAKSSGGRHHRWS